MPYKGDKGDKNAARPPEGSLVETRCLIKGPKSAIVLFPGPRSGPKSRTGPGALAKIAKDEHCLKEKDDIVSFFKGKILFSFTHASSPFPLESSGSFFKFNSFLFIYLFIFLSLIFYLFIRSLQMYDSRILILTNNLLKVPQTSDVKYRCMCWIALKNKSLRGCCFKNSLTSVQSEKENYFVVLKVNVSYF